MLNLKSVKLLKKKKKICPSTRLDFSENWMSTQEIKVMPDSQRWTLH